MADTNHPDYFPELRLHTFESYAHKWAVSGYWPFMKRIVLYRTPVASYDFNKKYLLFFELSEITDKGDKDFARLLKGPDWLVWLGESANKFREIYKKEPGENYIDEWVVEMELPEGIDNKHSWILFSRTDEEATSEQDKPRVFPCTPGTKWDRIEIALLPSGEKFSIKTPTGNGYYDYIDLKLHKQSAKSKKPGNLWGFLKILAERNGFFSLDGVINFEELSSNAKRLNKHFKQLFGIEESIYQDRCDKIGGYKTKFKISQIPDDNVMVNRRSLIDEELEDPKYNNIKKGSYYPEHSTFKKE